VPLSRNLGTLTSWKPLGPSGPVTELLYLYYLLNCSGNLGANKFIQNIRKKGLGKRLFGRPNDEEKNRCSNYIPCGHRNDHFEWDLTLAAADLSVPLRERSFCYHKTEDNAKEYPFRIKTEVELNKSPGSCLQHTYFCSACNVMHFVNRKINSFRGLVRYSHKLLTNKFAAKSI